MVKSSHSENSKEWWNEYHQTSETSASIFLARHLHLFSPGSKILEVACGKGENARALARAGHSVLGLDFSSVAIEAAHSEPHEGIQFKLQDLDFYLPELLSFDVIVSTNFKPAPTLIKNLSRGLKQGGLLVMEASLMARAAKNPGIQAFECYKPNELLRLLSDPGTNLQILYYSELEPAGESPETRGEKAFLIAKKTQLF